MLSGDNMSYFIAYLSYNINFIILPTIDCLIRPKEEKIDDRFNGRHFQIKFNPNDMQYYLKDLDHRYRTFVKINDYKWEIYTMWKRR